MEKDVATAFIMMYRGLIVLFQLLALGLQIQITESLEESQVRDVENENCSHFLTPQHEDFKFGVKSHFTNVDESMCPPWYQESNKKDKCEKGATFKFMLLFEQHTLQTWLQPFYCMTSDENATNRTDVIGGCLYSFHVHYISTYYPLPCNISKLNDYTCGGLNREGQLCGRCKKGFAPPVYSYTLSCVNCTDYHLNWLKYIGVAFGPLTIFCILICFFHISATSPYLHGFIFFSQIVTMPNLIRLIENTEGYKGASSSQRLVGEMYISLMSIWNLDMFRAFYKPFCIHPNMTVVQALALDYIIALYPLLLLAITYGLVLLHNRRNGIIIALWKPFRALLRQFRLNFNVEASLIESFATLYFLSTMKMQSVTLDLLSPTVLYHVDGSIDNKLYLYLAGDVEYFGPEHMPYGIFALFISTAFLFLPGVVLFLYPCCFFQNLLNKIHCNFIALRIFMDVFQGHYKDGTSGTSDNRFFSGIYFGTRYILVILFVLINSIYSFLAYGIILTTLGFAVAVFHPQRKKVHYALDCISLLLLSLVMFFVMGKYLAPNNSLPSLLSNGLALASACAPLLYLMFIVFYWIVGKKRIPQKFVHFLFLKKRQSFEQQSLLVHVQ